MFDGVLVGVGVVRPKSREHKSMNYVGAASPGLLGWEFIKEKVIKQENTHSSKKKRTRSRINDNGQENDLD